MSQFKDVSSKANFVEQEKQILEFWKETRAFQKMRAIHKGEPRWSFIDGPITANNPMGVHHAWGRSYKDLFNRYKTMQGHELRYQNGFDCQGLWVEVNVEKELGFKTKKDIEAYGLAPFVVLCKQRVLNYAAVQTEQSIRLGMWMDWDNIETLRLLSEKLGRDPISKIKITAPSGRQVSGTVEQVVGELGLPQNGGSYFTFSDENNYDIWLMLKKCSDNKWIYKGTDVMPWCWRCGTGISQHEIVTEGYIEKQDPGLTVRFPLLGREKESLLVWTTTPWTLTSNVAAAVGPELTYVKVKQGDETLYLSKGTIKANLKGAFEVVEELKGRDLEGWKYAGPFDDLPSSHEKGGWSEPTMRRLLTKIKESAVDAHRVVLWEDVGEAEGTGVVHIAPGCGEEDFQLHKKYNLPVIAPLDESGNYIEGMGWLSGKHVTEVTDLIVADLKKKNAFYRVEKYSHRYPECWRCHTPLVFRLVDEWFISMDGIREPMMRITEKIQWIPEYGKDRELDWLKNMHDWMISKKRYWGLALPIWECHNCSHFDVLGSLEELKARAIEGWETFEGHTPHRPYIDAVKIKCSNCGETAARIKDVGNPWLDAGIVSFSTLGYKSDHSYWEKWFPGDFITESFPGQFRNWFYSLLTMAAVLENQPAARTILGYQTLLAEGGDAMHKSAGNMIEFNEAADVIGSDVMRWMFAEQNYDTNILFGYKHADQVRRLFLLPLWNVYSFFVTYANLDGWRPSPKSSTKGKGTRGLRSDLDRWILARLQQVIDQVTAALDDYRIYVATKPVEEFLDDLSNWYVRRSRRRFWKSQVDSDKQGAYETLYEVLVTLSKLLAPFVPFVTEAMYQNLVRTVDGKAPESVHHCDYPKSDSKKLELDLLEQMGAARKVVNLGHGVRGAATLKVRQPLARALVVTPLDQRGRVKAMSEMITEELNVKELVLVADETHLVTYSLLPDNRLLGPKLGARFPKVRAALAAMDPTRAVATLRSGKNLVLEVEGERVELSPSEVLVTPQPKPGFAVQAEGEYVVALDTNVTTELKLEGLAREFVRHIQDLRKSAGFEIEDRIATYYVASETLGRAISMFGEYVRAETLSVELQPGSPPVAASIAQDEFDGEKVALGIVKFRAIKHSKKDNGPRSTKPAKRRTAGTKGRAKKRV